MEKPLAEAAGIGWQGKHTNLVSRELGSWLFLGEVFTTLELGAGPATREDHCGSCRRCLDACPTAAFPSPYQLDARRCISYLTIEHKGPIPRELRPLMGNRIYGCDDCLAVCPWNKFAQATAVRFHASAPELEAQPTLAGLAAPRRRRLSASVSPARPSSASVAHASCAMCSSPSATAAAPSCKPPRWRASKTRMRWCVVPPSGRCRG